MSECNQEATDLIIYILSQSSSVPTSWLQCRALVSIFHNGCFVPSKTKELLSPPAKDHRLFFSSQVGWGFIEFLSSSSWHFEEILTIEAAKRNIHWHLGFLFFETPWNESHWIYSLKPFGLEIQLSLFVYLAWIIAAKIGCWDPGLSRCQVSVSQSFISQWIAKWDW